MKTADFEIQGLVFERKSGVVFKPEFAIGKLPILIFWDLNSISLRFSEPHPNSHAKYWNLNDSRTLSVFPPFVNNLVFIAISSDFWPIKS